MKKDLYWISNESSSEYSVCGGEDATSDDRNQVTFKDNRLYFYSEVTRAKNLTLNKSIVELAICSPWNWKDDAACAPKP